MNSEKETIIEENTFHPLFIEQRLIHDFHFLRVPETFHPLFIEQRVVGLYSLDTSDILFPSSFHRAVVRNEAPYSLVLESFPSSFHRAVRPRMLTFASHVSAFPSSFHRAVRGFG